jgi:hypothetical protein
LAPIHNRAHVDVASIIFVGREPCRDFRNHVVTRQCLMRSPRFIENVVDAAGSSPAALDESLFLSITR